MPRKQFRLPITSGIVLLTSNKIHWEAYYNKEFLQKMINRMIIGHYRYGPMRLMGKTEKSTKTPLQRIKMTLAQYNKTGNIEILVDLANYCMSEFTYPSHKKAHYKDLDSEGKNA
jgi:hypothetical protein